MDFNLAKKLHRPSDTKILMLVMDGLGGHPDPGTGRSELETAHTQNLDGLARQSSLGLSIPVGHGITPGSGPGHLALFGYDPLEYQIGRGVLEATGVNFDLTVRDVAARGNFCTLDAEGRIIDRRAGRLETDQAVTMVKMLREINPIDGVSFFLEPVREHRFVLVLRGDDLSQSISETDPQSTDAKPLSSRPLDGSSEAKRTARIVNSYTEEASRLLADLAPANGMVLRGFSMITPLPQLADVWGLHSASSAIYPMYRGLAQMTGMDPLPSGTSFSEQVNLVRDHWDAYDYIFMHYKYTDSAGEDGDFEEKVRRLEQADIVLPEVLELKPDVLIITGDHSTPATMAGHSWHPVPFLLYSRWAIGRNSATFDELSCAQGSLGTFPAKEALPLAMAHAGRLAKFGA